MQVVQSVQEVPELSAQEGQDVSVAELVEEIDEVVAHALEELRVLAADDLEGLLGDPTHQLFGVHLQSWSGVGGACNAFRKKKPHTERN